MGSVQLQARKHCLACRHRMKRVCMALTNRHACKGNLKFAVHYTVAAVIG